MRLSNSAHEEHPWAIAQIAPDFRLLDVWALPVHGGPDEFDALLDIVAGFDPATAESGVSRVLFWVRYRLGSLFGWDDVQTRPIPGCSETTLRVRLPDELRRSIETSGTADQSDEPAGGFVPLYRTDDEWAAEISNATVHGVLHLAWVDQGAGRCRGQLAVYVKPRGRLGDAYLALIGPFRHLIVYPALTRQIGRAWAARHPRTAGLSRTEAARLLQRLHDAQSEFYAGGDRAALDAVLAPHVRWHVPGSSPIAGTYGGIEDVVGYMNRRRQLASGTFRMHPRELLVGEAHIASLTDGTVEMDGHTESWSTVGLYRIEDGLIAECHLIPFDPQAFDDIWGRL